MAAQIPTLIIGVGNILWADEGFGVRCVEQLAARHAFPDHVTVLDGGTQGLALIDVIRTHPRVLIFDAVDFGGAPAQLSVVRDGDIPAFVGARAVSLHQTGMMDVFALADLLGWDREAVTLIGVQPVLMEDYGGSLTARVRARIEPALALALDELAGWDIQSTPREEEHDDAVIAPPLALAAYEAGRPDAAAACRFGDERVLARALPV